MKLTQSTRFFVLLLTLIAVFGCTPSEPDHGLSEVVLQGRTMGTTYTVKLYVPKEEVKGLDLHHEIDETLIAVNQSMSTYIEDSEISQFNRHASLDVFPISADFRRVLEESLRLGKQTGTLDITMGPLINLYGFGPDKRPANNPSDDLIQHTLNTTGLDKLTLTEQGLAKHLPELAISFSAIAKGFGVDKIAELIESRGYRDYMVEIGGEVRTSGQKPDGDWIIAIVEPTKDPRARTIHKTIQPKNNAMATSGEYIQYFELNGIKYSHTIDPSTGKPIKHDLVSITVIHPSAMTADALATAFNVMGMERALVYAEQHNIAVYLIAADGEQANRIESSSAFQQFL